MRPRPATGLLMLAFFGTIPAARAADEPLTTSPREMARRVFQDARFGLFIHWGVDSLVGKGGSVMEHDKLTVSEYEKLPTRFNPAGFDAEAWVRAARAAGARFLVVTAKHHDGFCMFDSKLTRYDVVDATPFARDPLKLLADSCRRNDVSLIFAYSLLDWHHPDYFPLGRTGKHAGREPRGDWSKYVAYYQGQVRELCTNYGAIGGVWLDGAWDRPDADYDLAGTFKIIHSLQPGAVAVAGGGGTGSPPAGQDVRAFGQDAPGEKTPALVSPDALPAVFREPIDRSGRRDGADAEPGRGPDLIRLLVNAAGRNACLALDLDARPDGALPPGSVERLAEVGRWLETRGESVYGTRAGPVAPRPWGVSTEKAGESLPTMIYLHVLKPDVPVRLPPAALSLDARLIGTTRMLKVVQDRKEALVEIPAEDRDPVDAVIVLTPKVLGREPEAARR